MKQLNDLWTHWKMKKIVDLQSYKKTKSTYRKYKIILKDLKDLTRLLNETHLRLLKYSKYKPSAEISFLIKEKLQDMELFMIQYKKMIDEYDGKI